MKHILIILFTLAITNVNGQYYNYRNQQNKMAVSGDAVMRVKPDQVVLSLGVETRKKELHDAKNENFRIFNSAIKYCKKMGIPSKYIQTDYIRVEPIYYNHNNGKTIEYYLVHQSINIVIEDLELYEPMLFALLDTGINRIDNINFRTTKMSEYRYKVRKMAIKAAKEKAKFLSNETGIKFAKIISINEQIQNPTNSFLRNNYANVAQNSYQNYTSGTSGESLSVGMISIKANVTLTYKTE